MNDLGGPSGASSASAWNTAYEQGRWDYLSSDLEAPRYEALASMLAPSSASVLDLGCGVGLLADALARNGSEANYVGIDISSVAIGYARAIDHGLPASFEIADVERLRSFSKFDAVVLNEVLYYLREPVDFLSRILCDLQPGGVVVASIFRPPLEHPWGEKLAGLCNRVISAGLLSVDGECGVTGHRWELLSSDHRRPFGLDQVNGGEPV